MKSLVLFSGGVESASLLKWLLSNTNDEIVAVHFSCNNSANRAHLELAAIEKLLPLLQQIRNFNYYQIDIQMPFDMRDAEIHSSMIPGVMSATRADRFFRGLCLEDYKNGDLGKRKLIGEYVWKWANNPQWDSWEAMSPMLPIFTKPKSWHMDHIRELMDLTWSCLTPVNESPCDTCSTCILRNKNAPCGA